MSSTLNRLPIPIGTIISIVTLGTVITPSRLPVLGNPYLSGVKYYYLHFATHVDILS